MTIKSVCNNSFSPGPVESASLNGCNIHATSNRVNEKPFIILTRIKWVSSFSLVNGLRQIIVKSAIQAAHSRIGPSLAAQVAAKRYFRGNSSPPYHATKCIDDEISHYQQYQILYLQGLALIPALLFHQYYQPLRVIKTKDEKIYLTKRAFWRWDNSPILTLIK